jgi:MFS family permease
MLVAARFVQGIGGAVSSAVILAMIVTLFPKPEEQAKAFGVFSFVASAGAALGLLAGGLITQAVSWHWVFFLNLPIGLVTEMSLVRRSSRSP